MKHESDICPVFLTKKYVAQTSRAVGCAELLHHEVAAGNGLILCRIVGTSAVLQQKIQSARMKYTSRLIKALKVLSNATDQLRILHSPAGM